MKGRIAASAVIAAALIGALALMEGQKPAEKPTAAPAVQKAQAAPPPPAKCLPADFEIEGFSAKVYDDCRASSCPALKLTGRLRNRCDQAAGAQIKITATDKAGSVVDTIDGWPASTRNIQAGGTYAFDFGPLMNYRKNMSNFNVEIIDARIWR